MIVYKRLIIAVVVSLMLLPCIHWAEEAPVMDDSDHFVAAIEGQQKAVDVSAAHPKYDAPLRQRQNRSLNHASDHETNQYDSPQQYVQTDSTTSPLVREDEPSDLRDSGGIGNVDSVGGVGRIDDTGSSINNMAKFINKIQELQQQIQELRGLIELQAHELKLLQQHSALYKDLDATGRAGIGTGIGTSTEIRTKAATSHTNSLDKQYPLDRKSSVEKTTLGAKKSAPAPAVFKSNPADEQIRYMAAYELVKAKNYDRAISAMQAFIQRYPTSGYNVNAYYWLGELYLSKKEYTKAIEHFEIGLKQFPSSNKSAASMLKLGYAYVAIGKKLQAQQQLQQLVMTYPGTPAAELAQLKLDAIRPL